jgi:hypothetical protein
VVHRLIEIATRSRSLGEIAPREEHRHNRDSDIVLLLMATQKSSTASCSLSLGTSSKTQAVCSLPHHKNPGRVELVLDAEEVSPHLIGHRCPNAA